VAARGSSDVAEVPRANGFSPGITSSRASACRILGGGGTSPSLSSSSSSPSPYRHQHHRSDHLRHDQGGGTSAEKAVYREARPFSKERAIPTGRRRRASRAPRRRWCTRCRRAPPTARSRSPAGGQGGGRQAVIRMSMRSLCPRLYGDSFSAINPRSRLQKGIDMETHRIPSPPLL
jgi:hypothetical protein